MVYIATHLKMNVLAVEYPGYGIYNGKKSATTMLEDAETVYDYITLVILNNINKRKEKSCPKIFSFLVDRLVQAQPLIWQLPDNVKR